VRVHTITVAKLIGAVADRLASDPGIPPDARPAFRATVVSVISAQLASMFGGEEVRFYVPKAATDLRAARDRRIADALASGTPATQVAQSERVSERHVRRLRGRFGG
jgi:Mor family transcriptional regulator